MPAGRLAWRHNRRMGNEMSFNVRTVTIDVVDNGYSVRFHANLNSETHEQHRNFVFSNVDDATKFIVGILKKPECAT